MDFLRLVRGLALFALVTAIAPSAGSAQSIVVTHPGRGTIAYPAAARQDPGTLLRPNVVRVTVRPRTCAAATCTRTLVTHNARTAQGANFFANHISNPGAGAPSLSVTLSSDSTAVANGDTTCPSVLTIGGSTAPTTSAIGSITPPGTLGGAAVFSFTGSWTASATQTIAKACESSAGALIFETLFGTPITLNSGDTITITWTFSV